MSAATFLAAHCLSTAAADPSVTGSDPELSTPVVPRVDVNSAPQPRNAPSPVKERPVVSQSVDLWQRPTMDLYARAVTLPGWGMSLAHPDDTVMRTAFMARGVALGDLQQPRPWDADLNAEPPQRSGAAAAWLRWDSSERYAALVAGRRRNDAEDNMLLGADFSLPLGGTDVKARGEALASVASARAGFDGRLRGNPVLSDYHLRLEVNQDIGTVESTVAFEELSGSRRNDLGIATRAGVRRLESNTHLVRHDLGPFGRLGLYVFATGTRTLDNSIGVHHAVRPGVFFEHESGLRIIGELRGAEWLRAQPDGPSHAERYLHLDVEARPSAWLPSLHATSDTGRLVDVLADKPGTAHRASLGAEVRISDRSTLGLLLQRQLDGPSRARQEFVQFELNRSVAPGLDLQMVGTQHRASHRLPVSAAINERERVLSLSLRRRWSPSCAFYAGVTRARNDGVSGRPGSTTEVYVQIVQGMDR